MDLSFLPILPQRQDATLDQLQDLYHVANRLGMRDAADVIRNLVEQQNTLSPDAPYLRKIVAHLFDDDFVGAVRELRWSTDMLLADSKHLLDWVCHRFNICTFAEDIDPQARPVLRDLNERQAKIRDNLINLILCDYMSLVKA